MLLVVVEVKVVVEVMAAAVVILVPLLVDRPGGLDRHPRRPCRSPRICQETTYSPLDDSNFCLDVL